jgi:hypothetical protein
MVQLHHRCKTVYSNKYCSWKDVGVLGVNDVYLRKCDVLPLRWTAFYNGNFKNIDRSDKVYKLCDNKFAHTKHVIAQQLKWNSMNNHFLPFFLVRFMCNVRWCRIRSRFRVKHRRIPDPNPDPNPDSFLGLLDKSTRGRKSGSESPDADTPGVVLPPARNVQCRTTSVEPRRRGSCMNKHPVFLVFIKSILNEK